MNVVSRDGDIDVDPPHERKPSDVALIEMAAKAEPHELGSSTRRARRPEASGVERAHDVELTNAAPADSVSSGARSASAIPPFVTVW